MPPACHVDLAQSRPPCRPGVPSQWVRRGGAGRSGGARASRRQLRAVRQGQGHRSETDRRAPGPAHHPATPIPALRPAGHSSPRRTLDRLTGHIRPIGRSGCKQRLPQVSLGQPRSAQVRLCQTRSAVTVTVAVQSPPSDRHDTCPRVDTGCYRHAARCTWGHVVSPVTSGKTTAHASSRPPCGGGPEPASERSKDQLHTLRPLQTRPTSRLPDHHAVYDRQVAVTRSDLHFFLLAATAPVCGGAPGLPLPSEVPVPAGTNRAPASSPAERPDPASSGSDQGQVRRRTPGSAATVATAVVAVVAATAGKRRPRHWRIQRTVFFLGGGAKLWRRGLIYPHFQVSPWI